ncbi:hypothetical protein [Peribacillus sp. SCS-155]
MSNTFISEENRAIIEECTSSFVKIVEDIETIANDFRRLEANHAKR